MTAEILAPTDRSLPREQTTGLTRGLRGLTRAEARRWLPWRSLGFALMGVALLGLLYSNWLAQPGKILSELTTPFFGLWTALLMLGTVAMTQSMVAGEIAQGTAAWVVAKPVARPVFVLSKFLALLPVVIIAMVGIPGLVARWVFTSAESQGRTDFDGQDLLALLEGPSARTTYRPLMDLDVYLGILGLIAALVLLVAAVMILLGCLLRHPTAILALGLMVPIALLVVPNTGVEQQIIGLTPAWAMDSLIESSDGDAAALLGPILVTAAWTLGMLAVAAWWFNRREL